MKQGIDTLITGAAGITASGLATATNAAESVSGLVEANTDTVNIVIQVLIGLSTLIKMAVDARKARKARKDSEEQK